MKMCCCCQSCRGEMSLENLGLKTREDRPQWVDQFGAPAWHSSRPIYLAWRGLLAATLVAGLGLSLAETAKEGPTKWYMIYLTHWTLVISIAHLLAAFALNAWILVTLPVSNTPQPWFAKVVWVLRSISQPASLVVTIAYWALVYEGTWRLDNFWVHGINSIVVALDVVSSRYEVRLMHYMYVLVYGALFIVWSVIHAKANIGTESNVSYIYKALDWSPEHAGSATIVALVVLLVLLPLCVFFLWVVFVLRERAHRANISPATAEFKDLAGVRACEPTDETMEPTAANKQGSPAADRTEVCIVIQNGDA